MGEAVYPLLPYNAPTIAGVWLIQDREAGGPRPVYIATKPRKTQRGELMPLIFFHCTTSNST